MKKKYFGEYSLNAIFDHGFVVDINDIVFCELMFNTTVQCPWSTCTSAQYELITLLIEKKLWKAASFRLIELYLMHGTTERI